MRKRLKAARRAIEMAESTAVVPFKNHMLEKATSIKQLIPGGKPEDVKRFIRVCLTQIEKNNALASTTPESFTLACVNMAALNLDPDMGEAYIVPYGGKAQLQIGYMGLAKLMTNHPDVSKIDAAVVHEGDFFEYEYGTQEHLRHRPQCNTEGKKKVAAWAMVTMKDGGKKFVVVDRDFVMARKNTSKQKSSLVWTTYEEQGWLKTAVKALAKLAPRSREYVQAAQVDDALEAGQTITLTEDQFSIIEHNEAAQTTGVAGLKNKLNKKPAEPPPPADDIDPDIDLGEDAL